MRAAIRLAAFGMTAALAAAAAALAGSAVGPLDEGAGHGHDDGGHGGPAAAHAVPPGLSVTADGLTLVPARRTAPRGVGVEYAFRIADADGATVRDFDVEHERPMHMIVVRRDLTGFRHVHPVMGTDGVWRVRLRLDAPGAYRVFADFARDGRSTTLGADLLVPGDQAVRPLPPVAPVTRAGGDEVRMEGVAHDGAGGEEITFRVRRDGRPVEDLEPYLGARGHLVALREGDLAFLHVHPLDEATTGSVIRFRVEWPSAGRYRLFLQYRSRGRVVTAPFTAEVTP